MDTESSRAECQSYFEERLKTDLKHGDPVFVSINVAPAYCYTQDAVHELVLYDADYDDSGNTLIYYCIDSSYRSQDPQYGGKKDVVERCVVEFHE